MKLMIVGFAAVFGIHGMYTETPCFSSDFHFQEHQQSGIPLLCSNGTDEIIGGRVSATQAQHTMCVVKMRQIATTHQVASLPYRVSMCVSIILTGDANMLMVAEWSELVTLLASLQMATDLSPLVHSPTDLVLVFPYWNTHPHPPPARRLKNSCWAGRFNISKMLALVDLSHHT